MLRETVQKLLESQAAPATQPKAPPQCAAEKSLTTHATETEVSCLEVVAGEGERKGQIIASQHGVRSDDIL